MDVDRVSAGLSSLTIKTSNYHTAKEGKFRFHIVTWNVATAQPPDDVSSLLQLDTDEPIVDLYIIGLQEVNSKILNFINDMAFEDPWSIFIMDTLSPFGYVKLTSVRMQGLLLLVFSKLCHIPFIRELQASYTRTGIYGYWGNKGGVSVRMSFYGHLICFLNCHLAAHMEHASQRVDEIERILDVQEFHGNSSPKILDHKVVFLFGDLNFRIADHGMHFLRETINNRRFHLLWDKDQLNIAKKKEHFLKNFQEGPLQFKPTYKYDLNSDNFDSREQKTWLGFNGKKRKPAWTDRILWWMKVDDQKETEEAGEQQKTEENTIEPKNPEPPIAVNQEKYTSHMIYGISDHKPVTGTFILEMKKLQTTPLVSLCAEGQWSADQDALITYSVLEAFPSSMWDWIGLYKTGFRSHLDYVTYVWVKDDEVSSSSEAFQVYIGMDQIPVLGGEFILCYYSSNLQCIIGMSPSFQINESRVTLQENQSFVKSQDRPELDPKDDF